MRVREGDFDIFASPLAPGLHRLPKGRGRQRFLCQKGRFFLVFGGLPPSITAPAATDLCLQFPWPLMSFRVGPCSTCACLPCRPSPLSLLSRRLLFHPIFNLLPPGVHLFISSALLNATTTLAVVTLSMVPLGPLLKILENNRLQGMTSVI